MNQSKSTTTNVFKTSSNIVVNNNFGLPSRDPLVWAYAFASCTIESIAIFDDQMRLLHCNNRFGTLDGATPADLEDLFSLFKYYGKFYRNAAHGLSVLNQVFISRTPQEFIMHNYSGWSCNCRAFPVLEETRRLGGVVLLAHRAGSNSSLRT